MSRVRLVELPPRADAVAPTPRVNAALIGECTGAVRAQTVLEDLRDPTLTVGHAWVAFVELATRHGWNSTACRAFLLEVVKRARIDTPAA